MDVSHCFQQSRLTLWDSCPSWALGELSELPLLLVSYVCGGSCAGQAGTGTVLPPPEEPLFGGSSPVLPSPSGLCPLRWAVERAFSMSFCSASLPDHVPQKCSAWSCLHSCRFAGAPWCACPVPVDLQPTHTWPVVFLSLGSSWSHLTCPVGSLSSSMLSSPVPSRVVPVPIFHTPK